jgi:putative Holliday junction resolvase
MSVAPGRALGLDVGERRVGVAIGDELGLIASPLTTIERRPGDLEAIAKLVDGHGACFVVVGMPTGLSGREGPQAAAVRSFVDQLRPVIDAAVPIEFWDERLTTAVAERALREGGSRRNKRRGEVDAVAAAVILQGYLEAQRFRSREPGRPKQGDAL